MKERKIAAEQLQVFNDRLRSEGEQLQKSNQMLHGFALSVSHDILNNIDLIQVKSMLSKFGANISVMRSPLGGARFEIHFD